MGITSFLTREDPIAGLEISDTFLRFCFFTTDKKTGTATLSIQKELKLPPDAIKNGIIQNREAVVKTLTTLIGSIPTAIRYVIVSIPAHAAYIKLFSFPKAIQGKKLEETMDLTIGFQLPLRTNEIYLDWEATENRTVNEVMLAAAKKSVIDEYIAALSAATLHPVAIEPHVFALLRAAAIPAENHTLIVDETSADDILFWIVHNGAVQFIRSLPKQLHTNKKDELRKLSAFYEAEHGIVPNVISGEQLRLRDDITVAPHTRTDGAWLASIGAAQRGGIPRADDTLVSLMPMGTAEAYRRQRAISFAEFLSNATVGIAAFFSITFIGTWILLSSLQQRTLVQLENLNALPIAPDTGTLEARARTLNELTGAAHQSLRTIPRWSAIIEELRNRTTQGITVTSVTLPAPERLLTMSGIAANRQQLIAFKKTMEESLLFTEVALPPTNLEVREAIPFSLSFKLKDPAAIYPQ